MANNREFELTQENDQLRSLLKCIIKKNGPITLTPMDIREMNYLNGVLLKNEDVLSGNITYSWEPNLTTERV